MFAATTGGRVSLSGERIGRALTRRQLLERGAAAAGALALSGGASSANAASPTFDGTIRVLGLGYDLIDPIRKQAEQDLGMRVVGGRLAPCTANPTSPVRCGLQCLTFGRLSS
jgi:hypothetical protein